MAGGDAEADVHGQDGAGHGGQPAREHGVQLRLGHELEVRLDQDGALAGRQEDVGRRHRRLAGGRAHSELHRG